MIVKPEPGVAATLYPTLEPPHIIQMTETSPGVFAEVVPEAPAYGDGPHKLSVYFVLNGSKTVTTTDDSPDKIPVNNPATFIKISMDFTSKEPGEIHDLLRTCVGVLVQTEYSNGESQVTSLAVAQESS